MTQPLLNQSEALVGGVDNILEQLHLSETNRSCQARTWMARLTDGEANRCAISPPQYATL